MADMFHIGAMIANKRDQQGRGPLEIPCRHGLAIGIGKLEPGSSRAERKHR
jgi:hypothetical protein